MSIASGPGTGSFSLNAAQLHDQAGDIHDPQQAPTHASTTKDMTPQLPALDVYGTTAVFTGAIDDTTIEHVMTGAQQEFSTRLLQLCGDHPIGQAIVTKLKRDIATSEDPWLLAQEALKILYIGHQDCILHVQPYFYDAKVIEKLFYGDKGLFLRFLGRGGFGSAVLVRNTDEEGKQRNEVWKIAHAPGHYDGRTRRWHSIHTDPGNQMFIERLNREAEATADLGKQGIAPELIEQGTITGSDGNEHPYFSTKFVPGMTLKQLITAKHRTEMPSHLTADVGVLFGAQFSKVHKARYVHRDASKANLYFADDGRPIILDWGLSYRNRDSAMTQMGAIIGTPEIMSPEVAMGGTVNATGESDVYSLAVVLYEMQTGKHLFSGEDGREVISKHARADRDLEPLRRANTPQAMIKILGDALSIDHAKRPDAEKFARLLWPHSSLYLAHGKISFDEFLSMFETLGRLQLPVTTDEDKAAIPSKYAVIDTAKQVKGPDDLNAESASLGETVSSMLVQRTTNIIRRDIRTKIMKWVSGLSAAAALAVTAAVYRPTSNNAENNAPPVRDVQPDPNAPRKEIFSYHAIDTLPNGRALEAHLFEGLPNQIDLGENDIVALKNEAGTHAMVFGLNNVHALRLLGYNAEGSGFPEMDEKPSIPEKGFEDPCVMFMNPKTGETATCVYSIGSWILTAPDGSVSVFTHRIDLREALQAVFDASTTKSETARFRSASGGDVLDDPVLSSVVRSFPLDLRTSTDPHSKTPWGDMTRDFAATIPSDIAKQLLPKLPEKDAHIIQTANKDK